MIQCQSYYAPGCAGTPFGQADGRTFCVLHYPGGGKEEQFRKALEQRVAQKNYDFRNIWFPEEFNLDGFDFDKPVDFSYATFQNAVRLRQAKFHEPVIAVGARFHGIVDFSHATFDKGIACNDATCDHWVSFDGATFSGEKTGFYETNFPESVSFIAAHFNEDVEFRGQRGSFNFIKAEFQKRLKFSSGREDLRSSISLLKLCDCVVKEPKQIGFSGLAMKPEWFLEVDCTEFRFSNIQWVYPDIGRGVEHIRSPLDRRDPPYPMLSSTYLQLSKNAEQNQRYDEASMFRYAALDALRRSTWRGFTPWQFKWWYWAVSGYGERVGRALAILVLMWIAFAIIYASAPAVGFARWEPKSTSELEAARSIPDDIGRPLPLSRALIYSFEVMALQKPTPPPATTAAHIAVALEAVLGPVQAALLALAIRRKVSR